MNTTSDSSLLRLSYELRSHSLELRTKAREFMYASQHARKNAALARTALKTAMLVVPLGFACPFEHPRHAHRSPQPVEQSLASCPGSRRFASKAIQPAKQLVLAAFVYHSLVRPFGLRHAASFRRSLFSRRRTSPTGPVLWIGVKALPGDAQSDYCGPLCNAHRRRLPASATLQYLEVVRMKSESSVLTIERCSASKPYHTCEGSTLVLLVRIAVWMYC